jgi:aspartate carbamoyltransferase catalytic subunit
VELQVPDYVREELIEKNRMECVSTTSLEEAIPSLDILYMTRIQRERFTDVNEYERLKDSYVLTPEKLIPAKSDLAILHPLPRVNEISVKVDDDPRACYFRQAVNGKFIRMALILKLLADARSNGAREPLAQGLRINYRACTNPRCITSVEQELDQICREDGGVCRCLYCEAICNEE